jgi:Predicted permease
VREAVPMGFLTAIASVVPVDIAMAVYVPVMIYEISIGNTKQGVFVGLLGFLLTGSVGNPARFLLQKKIANIRALITIFDVLAGVKIFGFSGLIFSPILISMLLLLAKVYMDEFGRFELGDNKMTE